MDYLPPVVIMNLSYTGLALARCFGREGIKVYGIGSKKMVPGNFSKYVEFLHSPDSLLEPEDLCEFLINMVKKLKTRPIIFPTRDHDVIFLDRNREILEEYFYYPQPESEKLDLVLNKWKLYNVAIKCGVNVPKTIFVKTKAEVKGASEALKFPVLLKPVYAADWRQPGIWEFVGKRKAILVNSPEELGQTYNTFSHLAPEALIQEFIQGRDNNVYSFCSYYNRQSQILASFSTQKILQIPEVIGTGVIVKSIRDTTLFDSSVSLLREVGFWGVCEIEYKKEPESGKFFLIEVNPRFWDQHELSRSFGLKLPLIAYRDLIGEDTNISPLSYTQMTWIAEDAVILELVSKLISDRNRFRSVLRKIGGRRLYANFRLDDPLPFVMAMRKLTIEGGKIFNEKYFRRPQNTMLLP